MARTRMLQEMRADAYLRSDNDGAADRHVFTDVDRYINQGLAELYDLLVEARGRSYYRKVSPTPITTTASTSRYALQADFYQLISVRVSGDDGDLLAPFRAEDEVELRASAASTDHPTHYELQNGYIELLPLHSAGLSVIVDYVPACPVIPSSPGTGTFDGVNGWEEYAVIFAAMCMAERDEDWELYRALENDKRALKERIQGLAPKRDRFRAERVKDVRQTRTRWFR
jgi:hypothetical protein